MCVGGGFGEGACGCLSVCAHALVRACLYVCTGIMWPCPPPHPDLRTLLPVKRTSPPHIKLGPTADSPWECRRERHRQPHHCLGLSAAILVVAGASSARLRLAHGVGADHKSPKVGRSRKCEGCLPAGIRDGCFKQGHHFKPVTDAQLCTCYPAARVFGALRVALRRAPTVAGRCGQTRRMPVNVICVLFVDVAR